MSNPLPPRPNLDHLRDQAKSLLSDYRRSDESAVARFNQYLPGYRGGPMALHDAQSVIAREYGLPSWQKLVAHVEEIRAQEGITADVEALFVDYLTSRSAKQAERLLELYPGLPRYSANCALVCAEVDLVEQVDPIAKLGRQDLTPIEYVAYSCICKIYPDRYEAQEACARLLLDKGADPNTYLLWGEEKAHIPVLFGAASESGHVGIARLLLKSGANPNDEESVYHSAEKGNLEVLEVLAEFGADFTTPGQLGYLVFHHQFDQPMIAGTEWLLQHGANPNFSRTELEETPLHNVCRFATDTKLIELLLDHGADTSARNTEGETPYLVALQSGNEAAVRYFKERGIQEEHGLDAALLAACASNNIRVIQSLTQSDPEAVQRLARRASELMKQFAEQGNAAGLRGLINAGFLVNSECNPTPLHFACIQGQLECVRVLVERGAALDTIDPWHNASPIQWGTFGSVHVQRQGGQYAEVARVMIEAGSDLENAQQQLNDANLPLDVADAIRRAIAEKLSSSA